MKAAFRGKRQDVESLVRSLAATEGIETVTLKEVTRSSAGLMGRDTQNQLEVVDVIVDLIVGLAGSYAYDALKELLRQKASEAGFEMKEGAGGAAQDQKSEEE
ncbi:MAG TPA: hypothetical protein VGN57_21460 [Pirellulaceae bacterium]|jgi:hypothetical protein|nr:hypothetical protein [Pirellulaceae bacterium]